MPFPTSINIAPKTIFVVVVTLVLAAQGGYAGERLNNADSTEHRPDSTQQQSDSAFVTKLIKSKNLRTGWSEVLVQGSYSTLSATVIDNNREYSHWRDLPLIGAEYRYCPIPNITVGALATMSLFSYKLGHAAFEPEPGLNSIINLSGVVHFRTSAWRKNSSMVLYVGYGITRLTLQSTTLYREEGSLSNLRTFFYPLPSVTQITPHVIYGLGFESGSDKFNTRFRLFFSYMIHVSDRIVALASFLPTVGFGYSW